eukprot:m51a1_g723 Vacuolar protein sorting 5 (488) ;mRNA; r:456781-458881
MSESFEDVPVDTERPKNLLSASPALIFLQGPPPMRRQSEVYDVRVGNPQKVTTDSKLTQNYVVYTVKSVKKATGTESAVQRRYSDFLKLHERLLAAHPIVVIPPIPEKSITSRFASALIEYRTRELERFLQRIAAHPVLCNDEIFSVFLAASAADLAKYQPPVSTTEDYAATAPSSGGASGMFSSFMKTAASAATNLQQAMSKLPEDPDGWFADASTRVDQLESAMNGALIATTAFVRTWSDMPAAYGGLGGALRILGRVLAPSDEWSAVATGHATSSCEQSQVLSADLATQIERFWQQNLTDYVRELHAIRSVIDYRAAIVRRHAAAVRACQTAREKGKDSTELDRVRDRVAADLEEASRKARTDIERAMEERRIEFHHVLRGLAALNMECMMQAADAWKELAVRMPSDSAPASQRLSMTLPGALPGALAGSQQATSSPAAAAAAAAPAAAAPASRLSGVPQPNPFAEALDPKDSPFAAPTGSSLL